MFKFLQMRKIILILFTLCLENFAFAHPIHVSFCNLEIKDSTMTIAIKLFKDDFQLALDHNYSKLVDMDNGNSKYIQSYINKMFTLKLNKDENLELKYLKSELNEDAIWLYYSSDIHNIKKIELNNYLLLDIYSNQTNLVIVNYKGNQSGYRLNAKNPIQIINLK